MAKNIVTEHRKQYQRNYQKQYYRLHLDHYKAKDAINHAIRDGKLLPALHYWCSCGKQAEQYHHWSYEPEHWFDVIPVCHKCHVHIHH